ncbi:tRNA-specific 2-thiouridylase MnmA [Buchnera aphidicola (Phyllaphis fagi)]
MKHLNNKKIVIAMSGGVDSSVSAALLLQLGYRVEGVFMKNWEEDDTINYCSSFQDLYDVRKVCKTIGINLHEINFSEEYWNLVFKSFLYEYKKGNTPNPDILCNKKIKFHLFFTFAIKILKADFMATGHYAQIKYFNKTPMLLRSNDCNKDQTYFLYTLTKKKLKKILFPIGSLKKNEVRNIAKKINLSISKKPDSTGICFIGPAKMSKFLSRFIRYYPGNIITDSGYIIGQHTGLMNYTIGQRKGINIGGKYEKKKIPWYVIQKDLKTNSLVVIQGSKHYKLMSMGLLAYKVNWINNINITQILYCTAKTRYQQQDVSCKVILLNLNTVQVFFNIPVSSITTGQSIVFYMLKICIGGGIIKKSFPIIKN